VNVCIFFFFFLFKQTVLVIFLCCFLLRMVESAGENRDDGGKTIVPCSTRRITEKKCVKLSFQDRRWAKMSDSYY
jgi:hypothetical protein